MGFVLISALALGAAMLALGMLLESTR